MRLSDLAVVQANDSLCRLWGSLPAEVIGRRVGDYVRWVNEAERDAFRKNLAERGECLDFETTFRMADGRLRNFNLSSRMVVFGGERCVLGVMQDVTGRKRAEEAQRASDARYRTLFDHAADGIVIADPQSVYLDANARLCQMLGYSRDELIGRHASSIIAPEELPYVGEALEVIKARSVYQREWRFRRKDGTFFSAEVSGTIMPDGNLLGLIRDTTERRRAEAALVESNAKFTSMFNSSPVASSLSTMADGRYLDVNEAFLKMFERSREEVIGRTVFDLSVWVDLRQRDALFAEFRDRGAVHNFEMQLRTKSGRVIDLLWSGVQVVIDGRPCLLGSGIDISESKRAQQLIRQLNAELEQRVAERTAQLEAANKELEAFSYSVSHDLRAPLRAVDGFSQAVLEDFGPQLPADGRRQLETIRQAAQRMGNLIDDLLKFSRLGRLPLTKRTVQTEALVRATLAELSPACAGRRVEFRIGVLPPCEGDPVLLKQVWINLLANAVKYTGRREHAVVEIGSTEQGGTPTYFVKDNGSGFDMRYVHKLFGVFQRLHRSEDYEGTGVGLAIVHRVVQRHGGRVWAEGDVDRGAIFSFTLQAYPPS